MHKTFDNTGKNLNEVGGFSGGPVFLLITSESGIWHLEFAGIVFEGGFDQWEEKDDLTLFMTPAKFICEDGSIEKYIGI